ncbi:MAG TPA: alpha/beta fold hydrolase [Thermoleophilaceae bacterium]|nr:alpha/beta fold hydrolase [Thermoleophilaceae bacterium]
MAATAAPERLAAPPQPRPGGGRLAHAWPRSPVAFRVATGILCVHIIDDNFLQPQSGTQAGDHLVSGLVPIALLLGIAAVYPRLRPGARAAWAITIGLFGVVMGASEAGYYSLAEGPSGDDFTGLLTIPAGLVLIAVGATTLWTTRRTDDRLARRYLRRLLLALGGVVVAYFLVFPLCLSYVFTHAARAGVPPPELGADYKQVAFRTADGLTLKGWYVPSRNGAAVIAAPGRAGSQRPARVLVRHGYGVLLFDRRGEGDSDGDPNAFGWSGARDIRAAVAFLQRQPDVKDGRIGGIGLSVGGETLLQAAAESGGLKAVVSDGAGSRSIREDLANPQSDAWAEVPTSLVISAGTTIFSNQSPPPNLKGLVSRITRRPVLFIYGQHDQPNVRGLTPSYYKAAGQPKAIWQVPGASHTGAIDSHPREYERRVIAFFDHALLAWK